MYRMFSTIKLKDEEYKVKEEADLRKLKNQIKSFRKSYANSLADGLKEEAFSLGTLSVIELLLLLPLPKAAKVYIDVFESSGFSLFDDFKDTEMKFGLLIKYVKAYQEIDVLEQATKFVKKYLEKDPVVFTGVLLFLLCLLKKPDPTIKPTISKFSRIDTLCFYYSGANKMLLKDFSGAEEDFCKALALSKRAKDIRPAVIQNLSLASYLNHRSWEVFIERIPPTHRPKRDNDEIWGYNSNLNNLSKFAENFKEELIIEHDFRVLLDLALTTTVVPLDYVISRIKSASIEKVAEILKKKSSIKFEIVDNKNIMFSSVNCLDKIEKEIIQLDKMLSNK
ncbi:hypothetical protein GPJ56_000096 [Histomonas meleagridis]|uniref:uncharacterized protein n=1 Tax=Histomonas meleagridis TaxID=135588 RepID=UPI00355A7A01|nr:hypothetical protein GPJ56_000096 [Histomonas meleagridis]KAH0805595.1 hypothetical protein GO595_001650 [Histomonas meleagridis]